MLMFSFLYSSAGQAPRGVQGRQRVPGPVRGHIYPKSGRRTTRRRRGRRRTRTAATLRKIKRVMITCAIPPYSDLCIKICIDIVVSRAFLSYGTLFLLLFPAVASSYFFKRSFLTYRPSILPGIEKREKPALDGTDQGKKSQ